MALGTDIVVTHKFISAKADGPDTTLVRASNWNAALSFSAGADGQKFVRDSGSTDGAAYVDFESCSLINRTGSAQVIGDVVALSLANDGSVVLDDTLMSLSKFVVGLQTNANTVAGAYAKSGNAVVAKAQGAIARGNFVRKSATTLAVEDTGVAQGPLVAPPKGALGFATAAAAAGFVTCVWFDATAGVVGAIALTAAATVNTDASQGSYFTLVANQSFTLATPTNPSHAQRVVFRIKQDGTGSRVLTLGAGFRLGTDIASVVLSTAASKTDYLGVVYDSVDAKWDVVAFTKGF